MTAAKGAPTADIAAPANAASAGEIFIRSWCTTVIVPWHAWVLGPDHGRSAMAPAQGCRGPGGEPGTARSAGRLRRRAQAGARQGRPGSGRGLRRLVRVLQASRADRRADM